jgi:hypothetical protein
VGIRFSGRGKNFWFEGGKVIEQEICLTNLAEKTAQEVFDYISHHLLAQGERAVREDGSACAYRNQKGLRCAAGCLIAPSEYKGEFEGRTWSSLREDLCVPFTHHKLIARLQEVHDDISPEEWASSLALVAKHFRLRGPNE